MSNEKNKEDFSIVEDEDGSAKVEIPEGIVEEDHDDVQNGYDLAKSEKEVQANDDDDHPDDDEELRTAKRNRRRAKKDLIRKTNQEKDLRLQSLQKENEEFKRRLNQLERNTKSEQIVRIEKGIEDAQVRLEYAKMKLAEAGNTGNGQALVEAQTLWQNAQEEVRNLNNLKSQADQELKRPDHQPENQVNPNVQRLAAQWVKKNSWYNPAATDSDSRIAKKMDELMAAEGWDPSDPDYWDELDSRLQKKLPHRYDGDDYEEEKVAKKPRNVVGSAGREGSTSYGGSSRTQFVLSPDRVKAMKDAGAWDNPERKAKMIKNFMAFDRNLDRKNSS